MKDARWGCDALRPLPDRTGVNRGRGRCAPRGRGRGPGGGFGRGRPRFLLCPEDRRVPIGMDRRARISCYPDPSWPRNHRQAGFARRDDCSAALRAARTMKGGETTMSRAVTDPRWPPLPPLPPLPRAVRRQAWRRVGLWIVRLIVIIGWVLLVWHITGAWVKGGTP